MIDLHSHTTRCHHAHGTMEQFVQAAIAAGVTIYGFSDHAPMDFDARYRMGFDEMADYEAEVARLRGRYGDRIELLLGYEIDWIAGLVDERVLSRAVDYRIGSIHFLKEWGFDNPEFIGEYGQRDLGTVWREYFEAIAQMAQSGLFDIVGHLDLIKVFGYFKDRGVDAAVMGALEAIRDSGMAIELNTAGWRKPVGECYPSAAILKAAYDLGIAITFGSDAHDVCHVGQGLPQAYALARSVGYRHAAIFRGRQRELIKI